MLAALAGERVCGTDQNLPDRRRLGLEDARITVDYDDDPTDGKASKDLSAASRSRGPGLP